MLVFIYINIRTLQHLRGQEDIEDQAWKHHIKDILLNIEDDIVQVQLDDDLGENIGLFGQ
jgi:hypothetical protein